MSDDDWYEFLLIDSITFACCTQTVDASALRIKNGWKIF